MLIGISMLGWGILFWSTFLINHFDLFEERELARIHGEPYAEYQRQVSMVISRPPRSK